MSELPLVGDHQEEELYAPTQKLVHPLSRDLNEWIEAMALWKQPKFRAKQVYEWIHRRGVFDPAEMTNISKELRAQLSEDGLSDPFTVSEVVHSQDGTRKLLLSLHDGHKLECVLIPMTRDQEVDDDEEEDDRSDRVTLCVSTQVGCAMGCVFCASGQVGLQRGLGAAEIVAQVLVAKRYLNDNERLRSLVFMGMGEPLHDYPETARALRLLIDPEGHNMSPRRITVSTVGLIPGIRKLGKDFDGKIGLAVSLHAPNGAIRDQILPMNRKFSFQDLLQALREYPLPKRRRITIEYTMIRGLNDGVVHAEELAANLRGIPVKINVIPLNPTPGTAMEAPLREDVLAFQNRLSDLRVSCSVRKTRGDDVDAACGQLALQSPLAKLRKSSTLSS